MADIQLIVHFCRDGTEVHDDSIRISKHMSSFRLHSNLLMNDIDDPKRLQTVSTMSGHTLVRYLQDLFALVCLDWIPFQSIQIDLPNAPAIVFRVDDEDKTFSKARETLIRVIDTTVQNWPDPANVCNIANKRRRLF